MLSSPQPERQRVVLKRDFLPDTGFLLAVATTYVVDILQRGVHGHMPQA